MDRWAFAVSLSKVHAGWFPSCKTRSPAEPTAYFLEEPSPAVGWSSRACCVSTRGYLTPGLPLTIRMPLSFSRFSSAVSCEVSPVASLPWWTTQPPQALSRCKCQQWHLKATCVWLYPWAVSPLSYWSLGLPGPKQVKVKQSNEGWLPPKACFSFRLSFFLFYSTIINLQHCVNFCCAAKWFSYTYMYTHSFLYSFPL